MHRQLNQIIVFSVCAFIALLQANELAATHPPGHCHHDSRYAVRLQQLGYDTTEEGLALALGDRRAVISAIRYIGELDDPILLDEVEELLLGKAGKLIGERVELGTPVAQMRIMSIKTDAALVLAHHARESSLQWLRQWEDLSDEELHALDSRTATAVARSAGKLAELGDDRLARHVRVLIHHKDVVWTVKNNAVRALGMFSDFSNEHVEQAWLNAVNLVQRLLTDEKPDRPESLNSFLQWVAGAARYAENNQSNPTEAVIDAFDALADIEVDLPNAIQVRQIQGPPDRPQPAPLEIDYNERISGSISQSRSALARAYIRHMLPPDE